MAGRPPKVPDSKIKEAAEQVAQGATTRAAAAKKLGISASALTQRIKKLGELPPPKKLDVRPADLADQVEVLSTDEALSPDDLRVRMTQLIKTLEAQAKLPGLNDLERRKIQESLVKTYSAYQRVISKDDPDVIAMSRADVEKRARELRELFLQRVKSGRPQLCAECGVKLAQSWAREVVDK